MTKQRVTMYLLNDSVGTFRAALKENKNFPILKTKLGKVGRIYYKTEKQSAPKWCEFLSKFTNDSALSNITTQNASALFLFKYKKRFLALTFGYGRNFLDLSKIEYRFGLKVVLSEIKPEYLKGVDFKQYEGGAISNNKNSARKTSIDRFGINSATDILRGVAGEPSSDSYFSGNIAGGDSLVFSYDSTKETKSKKSNQSATETLFTYCKQALNSFYSNKYQVEYDWIDHLSIVKDANILEALNDSLVDDLKKDNIDKTYLDYPDVIAWEDIDYFEITGTGSHQYSELDLKDYLNKLALTNKESINLRLLKNRHVSVTYSRSGVSEKRWTLYRCLVSEQTYKGKQYALLEGEWYEISQALATKVNNAISKIADSNLTLPAANPGEVEADYNHRIASSSNGSVILMDRKRFYPQQAGKSWVEFCDLYSLSGKNMIHVKRGTGSSILSHLFAQGVVASRCLLNDKGYRLKIRDYFKETIPLDSVNDWLNSIPKTISVPDRATYKITFAIITDSKLQGKDWLPFFSKINLMHQAQLIRDLGLHLEILKIPIA